jgi:hypothetical protein
MTLRLYTTNEFAALIHRHPETVHRLRRKGRLTYVLINRTPMYREEDLAAFIAANLVQQGADTKGGAA